MNLITKMQVLAHQRHLEQMWHSKRVKLHQRLGLRLFQQDVKQVTNAYQHFTYFGTKFLYRE